ncbi:glycosyltransferase [Oceanispirochaeta crateris]|uniref:Glycosyltransferase n=1 Tax=Oceanispirochaeta crateris TaxID=2518645 RepID=A0A5C1QN35_9SPIO|nr:glycosyltransferase [Oceanispirochaeta crateris]QEN08639.1 glycosyltransferase [Oceanispirochaeta crateris]
MADAPIRILHLFPEFKRGGAQINVLRFIKSSGPGYEHFVAAALFDKGLQEEYEGFVQEIYPLDMTSVRLGSILALARLIRKLKPQIVHVNGKGAAFYGYVSSFLTGKRYEMFHTMRGFHIKYSGWKLKAYLQFEKAVARRMDGTVLVSPSEREFLNQSIPGLDESRQFLIPNGIEVQELPLPQDMSRVLAQFDENVLTLSRLSHQKDLVTMIDAFDLVAAKKPGVALHIMGGETPQDKSYADTVRTRLERSGFKERIFLWGSVKDAGSLIRHFDVYWTTALFEGLPTAVVEAALCRVLIVGTDCVGNKDLILPGVTGFLTKPKDVQGNGEALIQALEMSHSDKKLPFLEEAEKMCREFSLENNARKLKEMYLMSLNLI